MNLQNTDDEDEDSSIVWMKIAQRRADKLAYLRNALQEIVRLGEGMPEDSKEVEIAKGALYEEMHGTQWRDE